MQGLSKNPDEAKTKLEEGKKELLIPRTPSRFKGFEDGLRVRKLNDGIKASLGADKKNDEGEGPKQTERELQTSPENKIKEPASKCTSYNWRAKQDVKDLKVGDEQIKQKHADEEAKLKKEMPIKSETQEELKKKNDELIQENNKLLEGNEKLKKEKEKYEGEIKERTKEIRNQESKLKNITAEIEKKSKINNELEKKHNEQTSNLKNITEKLATEEKSVSGRKEELNNLNKKLNEVTGQVETQKHNLDKFNKEHSEKVKAIKDLEKKEKNVNEDILKLEGKKKDLTQQHNALNKDVEDLKKVKENCTKENKKLNEENMELKKQRSQLESELKDWKQKCTKESEEHKRIEEQIKTLCNQKSDLESKIKNLNEKFMELNKEALQNYKQQMEEKSIKQQNETKELTSRYTELDKKYKSQTSELDNLKSKLSSIEGDNKNLVTKIKTTEEKCEKEKQVLNNLIEDLKGKISKRHHTLYCRFEEIKKDRKKYMGEVKDFLKKRIDELGKYIKEVNKKLGSRAKKASEVFAKLRELCKNTILNVDYISNEKSFSRVNINLDKSDIDQIYINLKEIIQGMKNAHLNTKSEKETEINILKKDIEYHNYLIKECKEIIKDKSHSIKDREVELTRQINLVNQINTSLEEMKKENTKLKAIKERYKKVNELLSQGRLNLIKKIEDCNKIIKTKLFERMTLKESTIANLGKLKDIIRKLKTKPEKKNVATDCLYKEKKEQGTNTEIYVITKEDNQKEKQELILNIRSIIMKFKGEFELLKHETQNLLANEVKVTRKIVINQFKGIYQLIYQREQRLVKKIEDSYEIAKKELSAVINVGNSATSKVAELESLIIKLKSKIPNKTVDEDYVDIDIVETECKKSPVAEHENKVVHEENKGIYNIQLIDPIYSHEIFSTGILKGVTKENVYKTESIKLLSEICCFCLKEEVILKADCVYHSKCYTCLVKTKKDCILCKVFGFKPLDFTCDNCHEIVSLPKINTLTCMHKNCDHCIKTGMCNICKETRNKPLVRVL